MVFNCKGRNNSVYVCSTKSCPRHGFICEDLQCCGENEHKDCLLLSIAEFQQHWDISRSGFDNYMNKLCALYENLIKRINYDYNDLKQWTETHHKRELQLKKFSEEEPIQMSGDFISKLVDAWNVFSEDHWADVEEEFLEIDSFIQKDLNSIKKIYTRAKMRLQEERNSNTHNQLEISSSIVWQEDEFKSLLKILSSSENKICDFKCLYKASLNNFSAEEFHSQCDGYANTLVLIKNSKGKILGGFTPLCWSQDELGEYKTDPQERSFVFSLNSEEKYPIFEKQYAIECNKFCGPIFGRGATLWIYDKADTNSAYWHILPTTYHPQSGMWTEQSFENFIGAKMYEKFTILEWEVFQVLYE